MAEEVEVQPVKVLESQREYLEAITDPTLLMQQLDAESIYGPQFDAISLSRTQTLLEGFNPQESAAYASAMAKKASLQARQQSGGAFTDAQKTQQVDGLLGELYGDTYKDRDGNIVAPQPLIADPGKELDGMKGKGSSASYKREAINRYNEGRGYEDYSGSTTTNRQSRTFEQLEDYLRGLGFIKDNPARQEYDTRRAAIQGQFDATGGISDAQIADQLQDVEAEINRIESLPTTKGLVQMADESARAAAETQNAVNDALRRGDIESLEDLGAQATEALRNADPQTKAIVEESVKLAERATAAAEEGVKADQERENLQAVANRQQARISELEELPVTSLSDAQKTELDSLKFQQAITLNRATQLENLSNQARESVPGVGGLETLQQARADIAAGRETAATERMAQTVGGAGSDIAAMQSLLGAQQARQTGLETAAGADLLAQNTELDIARDRARDAGTASARLAAEARGLGGLAADRETYGKYVTPEQQALTQLAQEAGERTTPEQLLALRDLAGTADLTERAAGIGTQTAATEGQAGVSTALSDLATAGAGLADTGAMSPGQKDVKTRFAMNQNQAAQLGALGAESARQKTLATRLGLLDTSAAALGALGAESAQQQALATRLGALDTTAKSLAMLGVPTAGQQAVSKNLGALATSAQALADRGAVTQGQQSTVGALANIATDAAAFGAQAAPETQQALRGQLDAADTRAVNIGGLGATTDAQQALLNRLTAEGAGISGTLGGGAAAQARQDALAALQTRGSELYGQDTSAALAGLRGQSDLARTYAETQMGRGDTLFEQAATQEAALRERAGQVTPEQQALRTQASDIQARAQSLFEQAQAAPSAQKQALQSAAMDMMQRGQTLFAQATTPSSARQAAGELAQLSAQQARQLSADALGPLSAQRRRMAEQAARQQGLRTGRIGDQGQLASELLNREEQRAALRAEARQAQDLAFRQASGFATDLETDAERLRQQALGFETGGFDRARGIEGDIDAQRLALLEQGRLAEAQALTGARAIEGDIAAREAALLQEARLSGEALRTDALALGQAGLGAQQQAFAQQAGLEQAILEEDRLRRGEATEMEMDALAAQAEQAQARETQALQREVASADERLQREAQVQALTSQLVQQGLDAATASAQAEATVNQQKLALESDIAQQGITRGQTALDARLAAQRERAALENQFVAQGMSAAEAAQAAQMQVSRQQQDLENQLVAQNLAAAEASQGAQEQVAQQQADLANRLVDQNLAAAQASQVAQAQAAQMQGDLANRLVDQQLAAETAELDALNQIAQQRSEFEAQLVAQGMSAAEAAQQAQQAALSAQANLESNIAQQGLAAQQMGIDAELASRQLGFQQAQAAEQAIADEARALRGEEVGLVQSNLARIDDIRKSAVEASALASQQQANIAQIEFDEAARRRAEATQAADTAFAQQQAIAGQRQDEEARRFAEAAQLRGEGMAEAQMAADQQQAIIDAQIQQRKLEDARQESLRADELAARTLGAQMTGMQLDAATTAAEFDTEEARRRRGELAAAEQTAFNTQAQLANIDAAEQQNLFNQAVTGQQLAFGQSQQTGGDVSNVILGRSSGAGGAGAGMALGAGAAGQQFAPLFDASAGTNLAMVQQSNQAGLDMANMQAAASATPTKSSGGGSSLGKIASFIGMF